MLDLDDEPLDKTQSVKTRSVETRVRARAAPVQEESPLNRGLRLEIERVKYQQEAPRRFKRAQERSAERFESS